MDLLLCSLYQGKPYSANTKHSSPLGTSDIPYSPKHHPLGIPKLLSQFEKPWVVEVREKKWAYQWRSYHVNLTYRHFKCKNECYQHLRFKSWIMKMGPFFWFSFLVLEFCCFKVENGPILWIYPVSKSYKSTYR